MTDHFVKRNGALSIPIEEGDYIKTDGGRFKYYKKPNAAPELYTRLLVSGAKRRAKAFKNHWRSYEVFLYLCDAMNNQNIVRMPYEKLAEDLALAHKTVGNIVSQLCSAEMLCRTGTRYVWMVNPYVACKCNDVEAIDLQYEWYNALDKRIDNDIELD